MSFGAKSDGDKITAALLNLYEDALGAGNPAQSVAYVVFLDGSTYKARNGTDGTIDYSGTNAATVINAAIDAAPYGVVMLKGAVDITEQIEVDENKSLVFEKITISDTTDDGILVKGGATHTHMKSSVIGQFLRFPENYAKSAVKVYNSKDVYVNIRHIYPVTGVGAANSIGVHLLGDATGCYFNSIHLQTIAGLETGIQLESTPTGWCNANKIYDADIQSIGTYGVKLVNGGTNTSGNSFVNITANSIGNGDYGFYNVDGDNAYFGCRTIDGTGTAVDFWNSGTAYLFGCQFSNDTVTNTGTIQHYACHFGSTGKLENAGAAAAVADGGTIAHGLDTTPTWATAQASVANEMASVTAIGAANITIAIKTHAGAAGTAQTIYWRAKKEF